MRGQQILPVPSLSQFLYRANYNCDQKGSMSCQRKVTMLITILHLPCTNTPSSPLEVQQYRQKTGLCWKMLTAGSAPNCGLGCAKTTTCSLVVPLGSPVAPCLDWSFQQEWMPNQVPLHSWQSSMFVRNFRHNKFRMPAMTLPESEFSRVSNETYIYANLLQFSSIIFLTCMP